MSDQTLNVIILAAGKGSRMMSSLPKVLHILAGKPILQHVIDVATQLTTNYIYLVCNQENKKLYREKICQNTDNIILVLQDKKYGTGYAVQRALLNLHTEGDVLILYGDVPLISLNTLNRLLTNRPEHGISILTAILDDPDGYGRIIRNNDEIIDIVEQQHASEQQLKIKEINSGILAINSNDLKYLINKLIENDIQQECYLTNIVALARHEGRKIKAIQPLHNSEIIGINNKLQLAHLERTFQKEQAKNFLLSGVTISDPDRFDLRGKFKHGKDVLIDTNVIFEGLVIVGDQVTIGTGCILRNSIISNNVTIEPYSIIEESYIGPNSILGPFVHLRTGNKLEKDTRVGNFVEMKNTHLGHGSKASHLSYLGDAEIGSRVNIGAGTITCNYNGISKNKTVIGNNVFIGSNTQLIAPVTIGNNVTIGAGTTVTHDILDNEIVISRVQQRSITNKKNSKEK